VPSPRDVLRTIREELRQIFLERDELIDGALVALVAAQHVLVIGPPGTAKSMLADEVCRRLTGARYFQWLLTRFTTPEELFGAVSLKALEEDDYRRLTTHKLPEAHIAFLDEIFKASSSILNTILTLMNERRFHNGRDAVAVPLLTLFAASNELPEDDELLALHDRFLLRFVVDYLDEDFRFLKLLQARPATKRTPLALDARGRAPGGGAARPGDVLRADRHPARAAREGLVVSDRRYAQAVGVLRATPTSRTRHGDDDDVPFLEHVLWRDPAGGRRCAPSSASCCAGTRTRSASSSSSRASCVSSAAPWDTRELQSRAAVEAHTKIGHPRQGRRHPLARARRRPADRSGRGLRHEIAQIEREMLGRL
jgi:MoxR-like ATPase